MGDKKESSESPLCQ